ncbi:MAG: hypothetical protein QOI47_875 [Actinomycetota bacterium]|nr:hypothetical protein [Actinomycetota bacterium]
MRVDVDDPDDPRVDPYRSLRGRPGGDATFVVEGITTLRQALAAGVRLRSALVLPARVDAFVGLDIPVYVASRDVLEGITGFDVHRGLLALADRPAARTVDDVLRDARRVLVIDGVTDAENVGALFRNAAAFGVDAVLLDPLSCDPLLRRCVRVSVGTVLRVAFARSADWPAALRARGVTTLALTPNGEVAVTDVRVPDAFALVVGAEGSGLAPALLQAADVRVRIPMSVGVDSLNVATAAAVALSHLTA